MNPSIHLLSQHDDQCQTNTKNTLNKQPHTPSSAGLCKRSRKSMLWCHWKANEDPLSCLKLLTFCTKDWCHLLCGLYLWAPSQVLPAHARIVEKQKARGRAVGRGPLLLNSSSHWTKELQSQRVFIRPFSLERTLTQALWNRHKTDYRASLDWDTREVQTFSLLWRTHLPSFLSCTDPGKPPAQPASTVLPWGHCAVIQMWTREKIFTLRIRGRLTPTI